MFEAIVEKYARQFGVRAADIQAVIQTESSGRADIITPEPRVRSAAYGLMQLLPETARGLGYAGPDEGLLDPDTNVMLGTKLWAQLMRNFGPDRRRVYSAYNSGNPDRFRTSEQVRSNVNRFIENLSQLADTGSAGIAIPIGVGLALVFALGGSK